MLFVYIYIEENLGVIVLLCFDQLIEDVDDPRVNEEKYIDCNGNMKGLVDSFRTVKSVKGFAPKIDGISKDFHVSDLNAEMHLDKSTVR